MKTEQLNEFLAAEFAYIGGPGYGAIPSYKGDRLRPRKGGGGGNDAWEIEQDRQRRAAEAIDAINNVFDQANRNALYRDHRNDVYNLNAKEVERQAQEMERANRFAMARNGLLGGSVDIDSNAEINRRTNEGLAKAGGIADAAMADLQNSDENARNNLVSMANAGTDATTAAQLAANNLQQNADAATADRAVASVGDLFGSMANAYLFNDLSKYMQASGGVNPYAAAAAQKKESGLDTHSSYQGS